MASRLPSQTQVIELLDAEFGRAGYEIEAVIVDAQARPPRITVVADGDTPLDLDTAAALSRAASELLDQLDGDERYLLEVSSPGVQRPLTSEKHYRRAHGRRVEVTLCDGSSLSGRVGAIESGTDTLALVVRAGRDWELRELAIAEIAEAVVQVEFSPPSRRELELVGQRGRIVGTEATG